MAVAAAQAQHRVGRHALWSERRHEARGELGHVRTCGDFNRTRLVAIGGIEGNAQGSLHEGREIRQILARARVARAQEAYAPALRDEAALAKAPSATPPGDSTNDEDNSAHEA